MRRNARYQKIFLPPRSGAAFFASLSLLFFFRPSFPRSARPRAFLSRMLPFCSCPAPFFPVCSLFTRARPVPVPLLLSRPPFPPQEQSPPRAAALSSAFFSPHTPAYLSAFPFPRFPFRGRFLTFEKFFGKNKKILVVTLDITIKGCYTVDVIKNVTSKKQTTGGQRK